MASSSSSFMATAQSCSSYDVFLSFRGEDTRDSFTDHLYTALNQAGIRTFRDDAMDRGKQVSSELEKAIHESAISVIVFSERYATSSWCLDEVMRIIEKHETSSSKHEVIPVFYKVDPSDVRHQRGSFKETFDAYEDKIKAITNLEKKIELVKKVGAWRDSLNKAATLTGLVYKDGYESRFIMQIMNVVIKKVDCKALYVEEKLVGIELDVAKIEYWLQKSSPDEAILLIDGMGGIGKSTLAKCIFNSNFRNFDGSCYLADINKVTSNDPTTGLCRLQSQLLSRVLNGEKEERIWNEDEGTVKVTNAICSKKVLLILDDVATSEQLDALLGPKRFYPGSKVIITTRNKELSTAFRGHPKVHSVKTLSTTDATKLFSLYAFNQRQPIEPYIVQSEVSVRHCMGLPLALKVLGSSLGRMTIDEWEDAIRKLEAFPHPEIQEIIQISYDTLKDDTDKDLFLHIACFFEGEEKDFIVKLLAQCGLYPKAGIRDLMDRCLIDVDEYGRVVMHQLIKDMGREIVLKESPKDPGKRSRLWHHEDCFNVLQDHSGTKKVEGLMLDMHKMKEAKSTTTLRMSNPRKRRHEEYIGERMHGNYADFKIGALEKMKNLTLLQLNYVTFSGGCKKLPRKLRLLRWHGFPLEAILIESCFNKLVVLDMSHSKLKCVWVGSKSIESLKILNLSHSVELIKTPDFGGFPGLESLILKGCSSLIEVHKSITCLEELVLLDLTGCRSLRDLPSLPRCLVSIQMSGCPNLGVLGRVQSFDLASPFSKLEDVNFSFCNLTDDLFPNDMSSLVSLLSLNLDGNNVTFLPKCLLTLPRIFKIYLQHCPKLRSVLGWQKYTCLLNIYNNTSLERVELRRECSEINYDLCQKLFEVEGRYKIRRIDKVERKIIRYLGLESDAGEGMDLGLKVLHEFGIFSTFVSEEQTPSRFRYEARGPRISFESPWHPNMINDFSIHNQADIHRLHSVLREYGIFSTYVLEKPTPSLFGYKARGPEISFQVPWHPNDSPTSAFNLCVVLSRLRRPLVGSFFNSLRTIVHNKTKDFEWEYKTTPKYQKDKEYITWLSLWRCGNLLEAGDQILICIDQTSNIVVEECRVSFIYEDDEQLDEETNEAHHVILFDQISWADRMHQDISDYAHSGDWRSFPSRCCIKWV